MFCKTLGTTLSYNDMDRLTGNLASYLQRLPNMRKGDRVAIMMPNVLQNPIAIFAALRSGFTVVNTNPLYTPRELKHQLSDSGASAWRLSPNPWCHRYIAKRRGPGEYMLPAHKVYLRQFSKRP